MKQFVLAAVFALGAGGAQAWTATMDVSGAAEGSHEISGFTQSTSGNPFLSSEAFAEGVNAGITTCENAPVFEIDYFFGDDAEFGGHLLFTMERMGDGFRAVEPAIFYDVFDAQGDPVDTFADFDSASVRIESAACMPNGGLDIAVTFKGTLRNNMGTGDDVLMATGTADAQFDLFDMSEY